MSTIQELWTAYHDLVVSHEEENSDPKVRALLEKIRGIIQILEYTGVPSRPTHCIQCHHLFSVMRTGDDRRTISGICYPCMRGMTRYEPDWAQYDRIALELGQHINGWYQKEQEGQDTPIPSQTYCDHCHLPLWAEQGARPTGGYDISVCCNQCQRRYSMYVLKEEQREEIVRLLGQQLNISYWMQQGRPVE